MHYKRPSKYRTPVQRIADLEVLPVFFKLQGKKALLIGNSNAALWKAELLLASGAEVHAYADNIKGQFENLIILKGSKLIIHPPEAFNDMSLSGMIIAIGDFENLDDAANFHDLTQKAGVLCNVVDKPDYCDFQFGSIVNRSPIVIGISTSGVAPILAQEIRQRIEFLLPPNLSSWGKLARKIRFDVMKKLKSKTKRHAFWKYFSEQVFNRSSSATNTNILQHFSDDISTIDTTGPDQFTSIDLTNKKVTSLSRT